MSLLLRSRSTRPERMDTESLSLDEMAPILQTLETINRRLGGLRATLGHLSRFSKTWNRHQEIRIVDWGTGGADLPRAIARWARQQHFRVNILGIDNNPVVLEYARAACRHYPEISLQTVDVNDLKPPEHPFDYAISSLSLHHMSDDTIVQLLKQSDQWARRGIIMNDLKRSARAWAWIWALSRVFRAPPIVRHDGPLSVRRAFTQPELETYAREAGLGYLKVYTHFGYRFTLAGEKTVTGYRGNGVTTEPIPQHTCTDSHTPVLRYAGTDV